MQVLHRFVLRRVGRRPKAEAPQAAHKPHSTKLHVAIVPRRETCGGLAAQPKMTMQGCLSHAVILCRIEWRAITPRHDTAGPSAACRVTDIQRAGLQCPAGVPRGGGAKQAAQGGWAAKGAALGLGQVHVDPLAHRHQYCREQASDKRRSHRSFSLSDRGFKAAYPLPRQRTTRCLTHHKI